MAPSLLLSAILAAIVGLLAHTIAGKVLWQLPVYLVLTAVGVFAAEALAVVMGGGLLRYGSVPVGSAVLGGIVGAGLAWLLTYRAATRIHAGDEYE